MAVLRGAVMVALCVLSLAVVGHALPMNPRVGRERERDAPDMPDHPNVDEGQYRRPRMPDTPGLDLEEYNRYWQEMAKDNPGKHYSYNYHGEAVRVSLPFPVSYNTVLQEKLKQINPEQLAKLHPRVSEKMARDSEAIRSRLEEARRMNMDEMRELQRWVVCTCVGSTDVFVPLCAGFVTFLQVLLLLSAQWLHASCIFVYCVHNV